MTTDTKIRIKNRIVGFLEYVCSWPLLLIALAIILAALATLDVLDLGLRERWPALWNGWFYRSQTDTFFSFIGSTLLLMAFAAVLQTNREARRDTSFKLRPYMRIAWRSAPELNERQGQEIRNTCLVLVNNGNGLMRNIKYKIWVSGKEVPVRNHSLITKDGIFTKVVYAKGFTDSPLGNQDSHTVGIKRKNDDIIKTERIAIVGTYEDVDRHTFDFSFESDGSQQSWFREMDFQYQRTSIRSLVRWLLKYL